MTYTPSGQWFGFLRLELVRIAGEEEFGLGQWNNKLDPFKKWKASGTTYNSIISSYLLKYSESFLGLCLSSCESSSIASMAVDLFERDPRNEPPSWRVLDKKLLTLLLLLCRVVRDVGGSYKWYNHGWESETFAFSHSSILTALIWF